MAVLNLTKAWIEAQQSSKPYNDRVLVPKVAADFLALPHQNVYTLRSKLHRPCGSSRRFKHNEDA